MMAPAALLLLGALTAVVAPRLPARADWPDREPVVALWVWLGVPPLGECGGGRAAVLRAVDGAERGGRLGRGARAGVRARAGRRRRGVRAGRRGVWAVATAVALACGGLWTGAMLAREIVRARRQRQRRHAELRLRAPLLPGEEPDGDRLVVVEGERPDAWWLPGPAPRLVITTAALRRLEERQVDAVVAHEQGHARARHHWLLHCSAALAGGFPRVLVFAAFRDEMHRLVELAADDTASRRHGRLTIALALVGLNEDRGVFGPCPAPEDHVPRQVDRLLAPPRRLSPARRLRLTAYAALLSAVPVLVAFVPALRALGRS